MAVVFPDHTHLLFFLFQFFVACYIFVLIKLISSIYILYIFAFVSFMLLIMFLFLFTVLFNFKLIVNGSSVFCC